MAFAKFDTHAVTRACQLSATRLNELDCKSPRLSRVMKILALSVHTSEGQMYLTDDDLHEIGDNYFQAPDR